MPTAKAQPKPLTTLITKLQSAIGATTTDLAHGDIDVDGWRTEMERQLTKHATAAYIAGSGRQMHLDELARKRIAGDVRVQVQFLDQFAVEIQSASEFERGWQSRAESYADSLSAPFWRGRIKVLPLPSVPGDMSTPCGTHCKCSWSIDELDAEAGDYDCTWIRHASDSCSGCVERAAQWAPLRIRQGVLQ